MIEIPTFESACAQLDALIASDRVDPAIDARCVPIVLRHAARAPRAVVLLHGFTNCPRQFAAFAEQLFARGYNVIVPRIPRHGLSDKETGELAELTVAELTACAANAARLAGGLGSATAVLGLSLGATMAAWLAQTHALERVVAVAPFFSIAHVPSIAEPVVAGALAIAPNAQLWWDPRERERVGPAHGYPRFSTHALARCLELGRDVYDMARAGAPRTARTTLALNPADPAIDLAAARDVWTAWRAHEAAVDEFDFAGLDARHDIIEPTTYADAPRLVYPVLLDLLER